MTINVIQGPAAIREGKYWRGWVNGNIQCRKRRLTVEKAFDDSIKLMRKYGFELP